MTKYVTDMDYIIGPWNPVGNVSNYEANPSSYEQVMN
jgi:hypothetical protein